MKNTHSEQDCREELRGYSLRATPVRVAMLNLLENSQDPVDVGMILKFLSKKKIDADPATVFRSIQTFYEKGLLKRFHFMESAARYELASRPDHHHCICEKCGLIEDVSDCNIDILEREIERKKGFLVQRHSLEFFGLCRDCRE